MRRRRGQSVNLLHGLHWYWDLDSNPASIVDQHKGLSLGKAGTVNVSATGAPDGGPCINCGAGAGKYHAADVAKPFPYESGFTVNIWVYNTALSSTGNWYINHRSVGTGAARYYQIAYLTGNDNFRMSIPDASDTSRGTIGSTLELNSWYMLTAVDYGTYTEVWANGVKIAENRTALGARYTGTAAFAIGGPAWPFNNGMHRGLLAMAGQWNRPLNQSEMKSLYNRGRGRRYRSLGQLEPLGRRKHFIIPSAIPAAKPTARTVRRVRGTPTTGLQHGPFVRNPKAPSPLFESDLDLAYAGTHPQTAYAIDGSGRNNNGVLTGYTNPNTEGWRYSETLGRWTNRFLHPDGTNSSEHIQIPAIALGVEFSIALWVKRVAQTGSEDTIVSNNVPNNPRILFRFQGNTTQALIDLTDNSGNRIFSDAFSHGVTPTDWNHVAVVLSAGGNLKTYWNGIVKSDNTNASMGAVNLTTVFEVGKDNRITSRSLRGSVADVMMHPFALDSTLIKWLVDRTNRLYVPRTSKQFYAPLTTGWKRPLPTFFRPV